MDRLEEIRQHCEDGRLIRRIDVKWLLSEVDRLSEENKEWAEIATRIASNHEASSTRLEESALGLKEKVDTLAEVAKRAIAALTARAEAAEAERDACKADLQSIVTQSVKDMEKRNWTPPCRYCSKYFVCDYIPEESGCCFEWRGKAGKGDSNG